MKASSADLHDKIATQYAPADDLPCADFGLLVPLKKSPEYRTIRPRIANPKATDSWQEEGLHFFVFELKPTNGAAAHPSDLPVAVFTMHPTETDPVSVVVVTPSVDGAEAEVVDLRQPDSVYTAPYVGNGHPAQQQNGDVPSQPVQDGQQGVPAGTEPVPASESVPAASVIEGIEGPRDFPGDALPAIERPPKAPAEVALAVDVSAQAGVGEVTDAAEHGLEGEPDGDNVSVPDDSGLTRSEADDRIVDGALLGLLRQAPEYQLLDGRLASPQPVDAWQEDGLHFFAFALTAAGNGQSQQPLAVFAMQLEEAALVSAVVVSPGVNGEEAEVTNLRTAEST